jgi:tetratricopeptide (TPR) repeat protein/serine/threonine protein kinase
MPEDALAALPPEQRFEHALAELLQAEERGERPDPSDLLRRFPELESSLRTFLRNRERFDRLAPRLAPTVKAAAAPPGPPPEAPGRFGGYAVLGPLGRGGRGVVYRVSDPELNRPLAVKVLRPELQGDPDAVRRFLEEAQVMGQLQHPGIVPVHGLGRLPDGRPYFAMKLVQGRTLADLLAERPSPADDRPRYLAIFQQVCQAVGYAHSRGVIHRDLKPANVMVGAFAEVQVMDWGLAKVLGAGAARPDGASGEPRAVAAESADTICTVRTGATGLSSADGLVVGTFAYMSPEQAQGRIEELDARADVFGLGAVLCEVLTGRPPYAGAAGWRLHQMAATADLADAFARLDSCGADADLIALARDCLAPERARRPRDAGAVAARLAAYLAAVQERLRQAELEKAAAQARAEEARATARAERRARRLTLGLAAAVLAVVASLTVGGLWLQRQQAEEARLAAALRQDVAAGLAQAVRLRRDSQFQESRDLLEQVRQRLGPDGPADLRDQVGRALAGTELARRLDAARRRSLREAGNGKPDLAGAQQEYAAALREAGLGQQREKVEVVAARVRASAVREEVVAALDDWAGMAGDVPLRAWLLAVARAADPDPRRNRLRRPELWRDKAALARLAEDGQVAELSPQLAAALSRALWVSGGDPAPLLRKAQARHPRDYWLLDLLGAALLEARRPDEAIGYCVAALALRPDPAGYTSLALALNETGKPAEALKQCEEALRLGRDYTPAHINLGIALCSLGRLDEGIGHLEEALRLEHDPAKEHYDASAKAHYNLGIARLARGQVDKAVEHCREAVRLEPENPEARLNLGNAVQAKGRLDEAIACYHKVLKINPKHVGALTNLGAVLYDRGQREEAVRRFNEALSLDPRSALALTNLGVAFFDKGSLGEALRLHERALGCDPRCALAHNNLGLVLKELGKGDEAVKHYKEALRLDPRSAHAHTNLGNVYQEKGFVDEAIRHYQAAVAINPRFAIAQNNLGTALRHRGRLEEAIHHLEQAVRINKRYLKAHVNLGHALYAHGQPDRAVEHYQAAIDLDRGFPLPYYDLGQALLALGRLAEAEAATRDCLARVPPSHPFRIKVLQQLGRIDQALRRQQGR